MEDLIFHVDKICNFIFVLDTNPISVQGDRFRISHPPSDIFDFYAEFGGMDHGQGPSDWDNKIFFQFMNGSLILADCYPEQLLTKDSRIECLTDMLDEVHLLHDDFVRNQESEKN